MKKFTVILLLFLVTVEITAEFKFAGKITNYKKFDNRIEFTLENAKFNLYVLDRNIIRFRYTQKNDFDPAPSYAVIYEMPEKSDFSFHESNDEFIIATAELTLKIAKNPCRVSIYDKNNNLLNADHKSFGVAFDGDDIRCFKELNANEKFYGLGEKSDGLLKNGKQYTLWNTDFPGYDTRKDELYQSIPFFIGINNYKAYGIFFDNPYKSHFNFGASNNRFYWFGAEKGEMDYYFIYGPDVKRVISDYTKLTGRMELPPKWAIGYQQSRYSYYPESSVRRVAQAFRDRKIPCDVLYLDIHYMEGYRVFTWNKERFPQPEKMLSDLEDMGFKVVPIIDPGVKADPDYFVAKEGLENDLFAKYPDGEYYQGEVWPSWSYFPDFTKEETRKWWGDKLSLLLDQGVDGFWNDMNEPAVWGQNFPDIVLFDDNGFTATHKKIHNVYALSMARSTAEGLKRHSNKRHFILTRAGYSGIQRYAAVWTGDNVANDEHLILACTMSLGMGLSGVPFIGSDVGGFIGEPSDNLYRRWYQLGAFTPFFRGHSAVDTRQREPYNYSEFVEKDVRKAIETRYRLLPFWYNEFYNSSVTGLPIMRAMFVNYQDDANAYSHEAQYQYMLGENLLVAPVLISYDKFKKLYLPDGKWYDWTNNSVVEGGGWIIKEVPLDEILLFVRAGGIIPIQEVVNYVGEKEIDSLRFLIFPAASSEYKFYEDDGVSYEYKNGKYAVTKFILDKKDKNIILTTNKEHKGYESGVKKYEFLFVGVEKPAEVIVNGSMTDEFNFDNNRLSIQTLASDNIKIELKY
ncbi:Alpha-glucosidase [Melioribacter roseus P3M-2]|jgi:alpha-glucosidase|uniref:Alpha-glucosidase n=1 Tax=Melioribacter roseus (strain DSM 23840 / JCM 17771 / VKM B-2668 / P3M-2) TaxID=1191523 RepID=I6Z4E5_MELRP|nr:glycoside hydrolase family 31 protein [Melioribacter roseus]AFN74005.1 Alpha-glucosidase [Melioribacter roseus P3M-2]